VDGFLRALKLREGRDDMLAKRPNFGKIGTRLQRGGIFQEIRDFIEVDNSVHFCEETRMIARTRGGDE
jgi:hypothetical protein